MTKTIKPIELIKPVEAEPRFELAPTELLERHPLYPRLFVDNEAVERIKYQLVANGFNPRFALSTRLLPNGRYQILDGQQRMEAAQSAGITNVPCWIEEMSDEEAAIRLITDNRHKELRPLEIGLHALHFLKKADSARSLKVYAQRTKYSASYITAVRQAAVVFEEIKSTQVNWVSVVDKCRHLTEIHRAPRNLWMALGHFLIEQDWSLTETRHSVDKAMEFDIPEKWRDFLPVDQAVKRHLQSGAFAPSTARRLIATADRIEARIEEIFRAPVSTGNGGLDGLHPMLTQDASPQDTNAHSQAAQNAIQPELHSRATLSPATLAAPVSAASISPAPASQAANDRIAEFHQWLVDNRDGDAWDERRLIQYGRALGADAGRVEDTFDRWHLGDWRHYVQDLPDESVSLFLSDPPFGIGYRSNQRRERHMVIANDGNVDEALREQEAALVAFKPKLKIESQLMIFTHWKTEKLVCAILERHGFQIKGPLIWVKNNGGSGDTLHTFAPQHERIIHAVLGNPILFHRESDVLFEDRVNSDDHPTEKSVPLLERLIRATTAPGELVVDPFGGVATTLKAAQNLGRSWWGCEIEEKYHRTGIERLEATPRETIVLDTNRVAMGSAEPQDLMDGLDPAPKDHRSAPTRQKNQSRNQKFTVPAKAYSGVAQ